MYDSVRSSFNGFTKTFEGRVAWMYLDIKGLVTTGVGNLIDPVNAALALPFVHKSDNTPATKDEIKSEWTTIKDNPDLAKKGYKACESITNLRLTDPSIDSLVDSKLTQNESGLKKSFPDWDTWPADAQLGVLSMAWAMGSGFSAKWPTFTAAAKKGDWTTAAANCKIDTTGNPGVAKRNDADVLLFKNAAAEVAKGLDKSKLYYPNDANGASPSGQSGSQPGSTPSGQSTTGKSSQATDPSSSADTTSTDPTSASTDTSSSEDTDSSSASSDTSSSEDTDSPSASTDTSTSEDTTSSDASTDPSSSDQTTSSDTSETSSSEDTASSNASDDPSSSGDTSAGDPSESTDPDPGAAPSGQDSGQSPDATDSSAGSDQSESVGSG
jgi:GH24 family phage-related lysozyme (muramidase)